jgi:hypothetical protein
MASSKCIVCVHALNRTATRGVLTPCIAGPSRVARRRPVPAGHVSIRQGAAPYAAARGIATIHQQHTEPLPFFGRPVHATPPAYLDASEKRRSNGPGKGDQEDMEHEVDDREWEMRVGESSSAVVLAKPSLYMGEVRRKLTMGSKSNDSPARDAAAPV